MSRRTPHLCAEPGCPAVLDDGPGRCPDHKGGPGRPGSRAYGWRWQRIRNAYIAAHPKCERCGMPALDVHHRDGRSPLDRGANTWTNFEALCRSCHRRATEDAKRKALP